MHGQNYFFVLINTIYQRRSPLVPVAARSKAWDRGRSLDGILDSNFAVSTLVSVVCCQVEVSSSD
jgi:hypothetical protein